MIPEEYSKTGGRVPRPRNSTAFTVIELLLVVGTVAALAGIGVLLLRRVKPVVKESACVSNVKELGKVLAMYQHDNSAKLPMAYVRWSDSKFLNWDVFLIDYLRVNLRTDPSKAAPSGEAVNRYLLCPDDTIPGVTWGPKRAKRRTYSMTYHDMSPNNWPPGPGNETGVGIYWTVGAKRGLNSLTNFNSYTNNLPAFRNSTIPEPDDTLFLTEHAYFRNILANPGGATIATTAEHIHDDSKAEAKLDTLHGGRFTYLLVDGHVETFVPDLTTGLTGGVSSNRNTHKGMWTVKPKD